ncbi:2'-5' RNA ligase superfamily protein [Nocardioides albertanoniae]|uniref:2'-5' RNA ligase superfamily protein n=1 Tax=Nocardioides albertanoniae TaxID=1175486 RepID=A0A543A7Q0_9ACTN|nr:2'-5' RNA ligase family protein [Nocardioides albertanoniae]TQL68540.1 2'-5' RNA ligase superfamily protein [Nocardioides albertanoniae]
MTTAGHSVLVVPVPELEAYVLERTRHYDDSFVSTDPAFVHAHITLLAPFVPAPSDADLELVGKIASAAASWTYTLADVEMSAGGNIHLAPEAAEPFAALTAELCAAFPQCPPYEGRFAPVPHLTVDHVAGGADLDSTRTLLARVLPARCHADRISLQWYANHGCRLIAEWPLGR